MSTETIERAPLDLVVETAGIDQEGAIVIKGAFLPIFAQAEEWRAKIAEVKEPKVARESRLVLKGIRVEAEKTRKKLKEDSLRRGKAIDGMYNVIEYLIAPMEKTLLEIETAAERAEQARKLALKEKREAEMRQFGVDTQYLPLAEMPDDAYQKYLEQSRVAWTAQQEAKRIEAERSAAAAKAEAEARAARERADAEERARVKAENEKLRAEADAREAAAKIEREKLAAERAAIEAKAKADRDAAEKKLRAERLAREKLEADAREAKRIEAERALKEKQEAEKKAAAPDREKLIELSARIRATALPQMATARGATAIARCFAAINEAAKTIEQEAQSL